MPYGRVVGSGIRLLYPASFGSKSAPPSCRYRIFSSPGDPLELADDLRVIVPDELGAADALHVEDRQLRPLHAAGQRFVALRPVPSPSRKFRRLRHEFLGEERRVHRVADPAAGVAISFA